MTKSKRDSAERSVLGDCTSGEVAILAVPVVDGQLRTIPAGTSIRVSYVGDDSCFVSVIENGKAQSPTHVPSKTPIRGAVPASFSSAFDSNAAEVDPLLRSTKLL